MRVLALYRRGPSRTLPFGRQPTRLGTRRKGRERPCHDFHYAKLPPAIDLVLYGIAGAPLAEGSPSKPIHSKRTEWATYAPSRVQPITPTPTGTYRSQCRPSGVSHRWSPRSLHLESRRGLRLRQ